ncbi:interleukin-1 receptor antagonist protein-like [Lacerta agilis]|uniref:interleukin-1 receptor antagonist protein-like n=1 Tax=Lacerta agilis TaxID=80427 RepID=UPI00141A1D25|nr:interleukin-1 receptor antagonist protein-like [Lacerta agilis]
MEKTGEAEMMKPHKTVQQEMNDLFNHFKEPPPGTVVTQALPDPWYFKIWDINQKYLLLVGDRLLSAPRNSNSPGNSSYHASQFLHPRWLAVLKWNSGLIAVIPNQAIGIKDERTSAIFMGNEDGQRTLSCVEDGGQPRLKLAGEKIMDLYNNKKEESKNFSFLCKTGSGKETGSFESVAFPGWFLSTSPEPNKPIGLSQQGGAEITEFFMEKTNKGA